MPWELDFWLNLATGWGKGTPELLPKLPSSGQAAGKILRLLLQASSCSSGDAVVLMLSTSMYAA